MKLRGCARLRFGIGRRRGPWSESCEFWGAFGVQHHVHTSVFRRNRSHHPATTLRGDFLRRVSLLRPRTTPHTHSADNLTITTFRSTQGRTISLRHTMARIQQRYGRTFKQVPSHLNDDMTRQRCFVENETERWMTTIPWIGQTTNQVFWCGKGIADRYCSCTLVEMR